MKLVKQQHQNGCAPACIAMIAGIDYKRATNIFPFKSDWNKSGVNLTGIERAIGLVGRTYKLRMSGDISKLRHNAIIVVQYPFGGEHSVVWDRIEKRIWDPIAGTKFGYSRHRLLSTYQKTMNYIIEVYDVRKKQSTEDTWPPPYRRIGKTGLGGPGY